MSAKKARSSPRAVKPGKSASQKRTKPAATATGFSHLVDERIGSLGDWRGETLTEIRRLIHEAVPDVTEDCKWKKPSNPMGVPVWSHAGILCTGETYQQVVKLTFPRGASLDDPKRLFNSSLEGNARRAIDIREGELPDAESFKALIQAAVAANHQGKSSTTITGAGQGKQPVKLLSGGNPQIAKAYGNAPVQAYIAAMPGWKQDLGQRLDAIIEQTVPHVYKAVKWNTPFYGIEGQGWFVAFHCFNRYIKVTFFRGTSLKPIPPGTSKQKEVRYLDIYEDAEFDEKQFARWVKQASQLPGEML